ncbi:MAG: hypothetical protein KKE17_00520, partial [Proteobacteria bacterium]|nr:hypothetical protein [Pseudomonadota bacterium]
IASGKADNTVLCSACHKDITGHESAHDMTRFPADTTIACVDCHVENVVTEHADTDCSTCHDPNNPKYAAAIASGRDGNIVECTACHVGLDHTNSITHDTDVPQNGCLNCHSANVVVEHVDKRDISCLACHKTAYQAIINEGVAGTLITCDRCHATPDHHSNTNATNGNCNHCHAVPTTKSESPVQGACRECHINSNGYVQGLNPTRTVHSYNTTGYIQDFGACLSCHDVTPYHAKPNSWPGWYEENGDAPGRGTFNIFMSEFKPSRTGEGSTMEGRSGYGEGGRPSRDQDRNWRNSSISFNMTRVNHNGTNYDVPTFDNGTPVHNNVGDGGSYEPPPPINTACDVDPAGTYVEAEDYNVGGNNWSLRTDLSSANGGTYLYATYNSSSYSPGGSPAEYDLNFTETGTYRIWFRGRDNGSSGDNSLWYGVDGSMVGNVQTPSSTNTTWDWARDRDGSGPSYAQIQINSTGTYSITVWAKENGMRFDGFYITKATGSISSSNPIPSGAKVIDPANCN